MYKKSSFLKIKIWLVYLLLIVSFYCFPFKVCLHRWMEAQRVFVNGDGYLFQKSIVPYVEAKYQKRRCVGHALADAAGVQE